VANPGLPRERRDLIITTWRDVGSITGTSAALGHDPKTVRKVILEAGLDPTTGHRATGGRNGVTASPARAPAEGAVTEEELLREENRELLAALRRGRRSDVRDERIIAAVEAALADVKPSVTFTADQRVAPSDAAHHRYVAMWSDWHGGENVDPETVMGVNDYDWEIMEERVDQLLHGTLSHLRNSPEATGLDILLKGDMCSGFNHEELAVTNDYPLAEQGVKMGYLIGRAVEELTQHVPEVRVASVVGNHPRLKPKPAAKNTHDNMDWVAAIIAKEYLRENDVVTDFTVGRTSLIHVVAGRNVYVFHGDGIRSSMPGVPWGGVMRRVNEIGRQQPIRIDHYALGHFHDPNVVQGGRILMNGSLKGVDEWVLKNFGGGSPPTQLLIGFDERASRITDAKFLTPTAGL
jgi:hypothetical protein